MWLLMELISNLSVTYQLNLYILQKKYPSQGNKKSDDNFLVEYYLFVFFFSCGIIYYYDCINFDNNICPNISFPMLLSVQQTERRASIDT